VPKSPGDLNLATVWEAVADAIGDSPAIAFEGRRTSWKDFEDRAARLAGFLTEYGLGPDSKTALYCYNGAEYSEAQFGVLKLRAVPANVNYRYVGAELAYVLENADAEAVFFDHTLADRVAEVQGSCPALRVAVQVGGEEVPDWAVGYEEAISVERMPRLDRSSDDLWFLYTGGTTGEPKAVMWSHRELFAGMEETFRSLGEDVPATPSEAGRIASTVIKEGREIRQLCAAPLMHGTSGLTALATHSHGGLIASLVSRNFDPTELWDVVEAEKITMVAMVGDAFGRPMIEALDRAQAEGKSWDLSSLRLVLSSGVMFGAPLKQRLLDHHRCTIVDTLGSSEGTGMGKQITSRSRRDRGTARFLLGEHTRVFTDDGREVTAGSGERGRLALGRPLPVGYYKDPTKTAATFPTINGRRWSIPGDWATVEADGSVTLLGRGSECINTGGEKVYPEEVEEALKLNSAVSDCTVVGATDERWGQAVTAVVQLNEPGTVDGEALRADVRQRLAGYKVPKRVVFVDRIQRGPNGKSDYRWAREIAGAE
jgi:fatty-acyl-CoA synthase